MSGWGPGMLLHTPRHQGRTTMSAVPRAETLLYRKLPSPLLPEAGTQLGLPGGLLCQPPGPGATEKGSPWPRNDSSGMCLCVGGKKHCQFLERANVCRKEGPFGARGKQPHPRPACSWGSLACAEQGAGASVGLPRAGLPRIQESASCRLFCFFLFFLKFIYSVAPGLSYSSRDCHSLLRLVNS